MSCTTVLSLTPGGTTGDSAEDLRELRNSHGSAPVVWDALCQKLYGTEPNSYMFDGTIDKLWPRYKDLGVPEHQRAVLMMTFDKAYVSKANYERAATDIRKWLLDFPPIDGHVNHWDEIASIFESKPECEAVGLYCTSVSDNPFHGGWNEENEDYDPVDWGDTYEIYSELDSLVSG